MSINSNLFRVYICVAEVGWGCNLERCHAIEVAHTPKLDLVWLLWLSSIDVTYWKKNDFEQSRHFPQIYVPLSVNFQTKCHNIKSLSRSMNLIPLHPTTSFCMNSRRPAVFMNAITAYSYPGPTTLSILPIWSIHLNIVFLITTLRISKCMLYCKISQTLNILSNETLNL